jgi:hypothetical protein
MGRKICRIAGLDRTKVDCDTDLGVCRDSAFADHILHDVCVRHGLPTILRILFGQIVTNCPQNGHQGCKDNRGGDFDAAQSSTAPKVPKS